MKQDKHVDHHNGGVAKTADTSVGKHGPKTENPIAEKDEVKQAEERQSHKSKLLKRKLRIL